MNNIDEKQFTNLSLDELRKKQQTLSGKSSRHEPEKSIQVAEYIESIVGSGESDFESVMKSAANSLKRKKRTIKPANIDYDSARMIFYKTLLSFLEDQNKKFVADGNVKIVYPELIKYFCGMDCQLDPRKGIYIYGDVGRGKSMLMMASSSFTKSIKYDFRQFRIASIKDLILKAVSTSSIEHVTQYLKGSVCFDDMGFENNDFRLYGNSVPVMEHILNHRYNSFQRSGLVTHITSNVPFEKIKDVYGDRIQSRLYEMCNIVLLKGEDKRKNEVVILK